MIKGDHFIPKFPGLANKKHINAKLYSVDNKIKIAF